MEEEYLNLLRLFHAEGVEYAVERALRQVRD
jgi:hypothetical protein